MDDSKKITFIDERGKEVAAEVILTYHSDEFNHDYVIFVIEGEDTANAAIFHETGEDNGDLEQITDEREWQLLEDVLREYYDDPTFVDEGCAGCSNCDGNCDCGDGENGNACGSGCHCGRK